MKCRCWCGVHPFCVTLDTQHPASHDHKDIAAVPITRPSSIGASRTSTVRAALSPTRVIPQAQRVKKPQHSKAQVKSTFHHTAVATRGEFQPPHHTLARSRARRVAERVAIVPIPSSCHSCDMAEHKDVFDPEATLTYCASALSHHTHVKVGFDDGVTFGTSMGNELRRTAPHGPVRKEPSHVDARDAARMLMWNAVGHFLTSHC